LRAFSDEERNSSRDTRIPMKTILIATDGSDAARAALDVGLDLAADEGADVVIARVGRF
jgi:nucleotide-binding universal stress UspA family protein